MAAWKTIVEIGKHEQKMTIQNQIGEVIDTLDRLSERAPHLTAKAVQHILRQVCRELEGIQIASGKSDDLAPQLAQLSRKQERAIPRRSGKHEDSVVQPPQPSRKPEATISSSSGKHEDLSAQRRDPEQELIRLRQRFGRISRRFDRSFLFRRLRRKASVVVFSVAVAMIGISVPFILMKTLSPWPLLTTVRHIAAVAGCDAARAVGLAPSMKGQPGYWRHLDRDRDGVACELWPEH